MKCHYEILQIGKEADESEIKTAYRKLALKWHPDKNLNDAEQAKEQFQLIQQAYEILSDRQERAWYDNHREQILRGKDSDFNDNAFDVYPFFTTTCFRGYADEENGFYTVYRKVFEKIANEDMEYMDDKEQFDMIPCFGTFTSDYDEVVAPFYAYWMAYKTKRSYVWLDPYSINEVRNRKVFKLMEKENKKVREKAQKERNEEVRALVGFVRKRDKRVQEYSKRLEMKILENRRKQEELSKQKRLERKKQIDEWQSQAEWSKFDNVKTELEQIERSLAREFGEAWSDEEIDEDNCETDTDNLYCIACNKVFRSSKSFQNHELSKKHKENVDKLKSRVMDNVEDEDLLDENKESNNSDVDRTDTEPCIKQKKKQRKSRNVINSNISDDDLVINEEIGNPVQFEDDCSFESTKKQKRKSRKNGSKIIKDLSNLYLETAEKHLQNGENGCPVEINNQAKVSKAKGKKNQKEADALETMTDVKNRCCVTCKVNFSSKNKLFEHLKETGHSVYIPPASKNKKK